MELNESIVGAVDSLWRYPVKSMRGEELSEAVAGFAGVYGDRLFAFTSSTRPTVFPWLTGREQREMLRYRPRFRHPERAARPPNMAEAEGVSVSPLVADLADLAVDVETPSGDVLAVDDPALLRELAKWDDGGPALTLVRSERALTDWRPISLFSVQTAQQLRDELGVPLDNRRFRANIYLDLRGATGFTEDAFVGQRLQIGSKVVLRARHALALGWARRTAADSVRSRRRRGQPMRTIEMSAEDMAPRVARYKERQALAIQDDPDIPIEAKDLIYARRILSVIGLEGVRTPVNDGAPIKGAGGMTIGLAICPPGQGPSLHSHGTTYETFTVLEGRFEISWNDDGRESLVLDRFDTVSVPPGVSRAFRNVGEEEGILQVLITGGVHDMTDIDFAPSVAEKLTAVHGPALDAFKEVGFTFTAGVD